MIVNPAIPDSTDVPHPASLNDLRVQNTVEEPPSTSSRLTLYGLSLAAVLAIGAFIVLDPLHSSAPTTATAPASTVVSSAGPAQPAERQEIIAPLTTAPATKSVEAPVAPAPVVRAPQVPAPVVRSPAASAKSESRSNTAGKTNTTVAQAKTTPPALTKEMTAPPVLLSKPEETAAPSTLATKPEETPAAPIVPKASDDTKSAPKPAATADPTPAPE